MSCGILILCTHNSARSVLAEAMLNHWAARLGVDVRGYSAGSTPRGSIHPLALEVLGAAGVATSGLRSKDWDEFAGPDAPALRAVITVCDQAAQESCPYWPGGPAKLHWGYPDPSRASGDAAAQRQAFELTRQALGYRMLQIALLARADNLDALDSAQLQARLTAIAST